MSTVTATTTEHPAAGSVDHYAATIRRMSHGSYSISYEALAAIIDVAASHGTLDDADRIRRIRNAVEAGKVVRAELGEATA